MKNNTNIILVGGFHETIELSVLCNKRIIGIFDNNLQADFCGCRVLGKDADAAELFKRYGDVPVIITPDAPAIRQKLVKYYAAIGYQFADLWHPAAAVSRSAKIGRGVVINYGVNISANVVIGEFVRLNTYANIMHDSSIGSFTTIAPNAVILGRVKVSSGCYIGANTTILPGKEIDDGAIIGAGSIITKNVKKQSIMMGVAAKEKQ